MSVKGDVDSMFSAPRWSWLDDESGFWPDEHSGFSRDGDFEFCFEKEHARRSSTSILGCLRRGYILKL